MTHLCHFNSLLLVRGHQNDVRCLLVTYNRNFTPCWPTNMKLCCLKLIFYPQNFLTGVLDVEIMPGSQLIPKSTRLGLDWARLSVGVRIRQGIELGLGLRHRVRARVRLAMGMNWLEYDLTWGQVDSKLK